MLLLVDGKPTISTSNPTPLEQTVTTLTCTLATLAVTDKLRGYYEWYKDGRMISKTPANTYGIRITGRANSGSYKCKVQWRDNMVNMMSELSDAKEVEVLCKFDTVFSTCRV